MQRCGSGLFSGQSFVVGGGVMETTAVRKKLFLRLLLHDFMILTLLPDGTGTNSL